MDSWLQALLVMPICATKQLNTSPCIEQQVEIRHACIQCNMCAGDADAVCAAIVQLLRASSLQWEQDTMSVNFERCR